MLRVVAGEVQLLPNMRAAIGTARKRGLPVIYAPQGRANGRRRVPYPTPNQDLIRLSGFFRGFGGRYHSALAPARGDFVASPHYVSSGFGGTNLDEHLLYKALLEMSADRADFLSRLFSRKRPAGLSTTSTAAQIFSAYATVPPDEALETKALGIPGVRAVEAHRVFLFALCT